MSWINHLPPACWSTFWKSNFKQQLSCNRSKIEAVFYWWYILRYSDRTLMSSMRSNYDVFVPFWLSALVSSIAQSETWAVESNGWKIKNDVHIDTYFCKPEIIALLLITITVSGTFSVPNWSEMCGLVDVLTVLLLYIYHPIDNRHRFSISIDNIENHAAILIFIEWHTVKICQHFH